MDVFSPGIPGTLAIAGACFQGAIWSWACPKSIHNTESRSQPPGVLSKFHPDSQWGK